MNTHREMPEVAWLPIQCRTRQEDRAGEHLAHQGLECFSPSNRVEKLHAGKVKQQEQPMFPGNLFAKIKTQYNWTALYATRDMSRVDSFCGQLAPIDDRPSTAKGRHACGAGRDFRCESLQGPHDNATEQLEHQRISASMTSMINRTGAHLQRFELSDNRETGGWMNCHIPAEQPAEIKGFTFGR